MTFIDFGMMGEVTDSLRRGLQRLMIAVAARDGKGLVDSIHEVGVLLPSADSAELERAMTAARSRDSAEWASPSCSRSIPESCATSRTEFGDVVRAMPFQLPENFLLIDPRDVADLGHVQRSRPRASTCGTPSSPTPGSCCASERRQRRAGVREGGAVGRRRRTRGCRGGSTI